MTIVLPSKPAVQGASRVQGQAGRRFTDTLFDTHKSQRFQRGRPFTGEREYAATPEEGHQAGFITPDLQQCEYIVNDQGVVDRAATLASAWTAPWLPIAKYWKFNYNRKLITFDYARGASDERESLRTYYQAAAKLAGANGWGAIEFGVTPSYQITAIIGDPSPYLPIFQAAIAGDPWLLGHIDEPNEALAKILGHQMLFTSRDAERGGLSMRSVAVSAPAPQAMVTPEQVLNTPMEDLMKMITEVAARAAAVAVNQALDARDQKDSAKKAKGREQAAKMREAKAKKEQTKAGLDAA